MMLRQENIHSKELNVFGFEGVLDCDDHKWASQLAALYSYVQQCGGGSESLQVSQLLQLHSHKKSFKLMDWIVYQELLVFW